MTRDPLEQLLRDAADADATSLPHDAALADRVRHLAARRARRTRLATGGIVAVCLIAIVAWAIRPGSDVGPPAPRIVQATQPTPAAPDPRAELLALRERADRAAALAERMLATERRSYASRRAPVAAGGGGGGGGGDVAAHVERAAFVMVYQAQRMPTARGAESPAAGVYRQVAKSFPNTRSAELARQRLSELEHRKDG